MKPMIGITSHVELDYKHTLNHDYIQAVIDAGGLPVILPVGIDEDVDQLVDKLDGFVVTGGGDIDPTLFGEEPHRNLGEISPGRDSFELALIKKALEADKPIVAICRGIQIMNIAVGGDMYQDIYAQTDNELLQHGQKATRNHLAHFVHVEPDSLLAQIADTTKFKVNTYHHQAVRNVPLPFKISGTASDGIIEAIESVEHKFVLGVQWHPEGLAYKGDEISKRIFRRFIEFC
ncbi:gamma-glutamyl-gamma-aminobutyrate hydrolase family protein [Bacillus carboniphilus]|uniref:Gamma-glutamyl-gamma-aminobutyrate hydrolase family protein n=1 Tax=Bacillus carboniphilus TaxID=86663 RepID=A0ABN0VT81_9BACI